MTSSLHTLKCWVTINIADIYRAYLFLYTVSATCVLPPKVPRLLGILIHSHPLKKGGGFSLSSYLINIDHDTHETKVGDAPCADWRVWFCSVITGEQRTPSKRPGMVQLGAPSCCTEDAESVPSIHLSCIYSALGMPFLQMLPLAFPSRITQIICDNQEKEKYKIHQNKIKVKRKKKAQLSMV